MKTIIYSRQVPTRNGTQADPLREAVENRGDTVIATFSDDPAILGKGRFKNWRRMVTNLGEADVVLIPSVVHLPPKPLHELYKTLVALQGNGVKLCLHDEGIDTSTSAGVLNLISVYRRAQTSLKIKRGQERAKVLGRRTGRPAVPGRVRQRIMADLMRGLGVRATGRKHGVSGGSVVNIKKATMAGLQTMAA